MVLDPMPGPNPQPRANGIVGQGVSDLDHRGLYSTVAGTAEPPQHAPPRAMFAAFPLDLAPCRIRRCSCSHSATQAGSGACGAGRRLRSRYSLGSRVNRFRPGRQRRHGTCQRAGWWLPTEGQVTSSAPTAAAARPASWPASIFPGCRRMTWSSAWDSCAAARRVGRSGRGALDVPGFGRVPPLGFHRAERGVFACRCPGRRAAVIVFELDTSAQHPVDQNEATNRP